MIRRRSTRRKATAQRIHATRRLDERYGVPMPLVSLARMTAAIRYQARPEFKGKARFVDRQSNRVTRWVVEDEGRQFPVVYDSRRKTIVTVLPEGSLRPRDQSM